MTRKDDSRVNGVFGWFRRANVQLAITTLAVGLAAYAVIAVEDKADRAETVALQQSEGRRVAIDVLCGGLYGVEEAGKQILTDTLDVPEQFRRPQTQRERAIAEVYARAYTTVISNAIIEQAGVAAEDVLRADGTIDCDRLKTAARTLQDDTG